MRHVIRLSLFVHNKDKKLKTTNDERQTTNQLGMSILEVVLASAMFVVFASAAVTALLQNYSANRLGAEFTIANQFASEGIEAVRSIKNQGFSKLNAPQGGVIRSSNVWTFSGANNTFASGKTYTRTLSVASALRDCSTKDIIESGSQTYTDTDTKKVTSTVDWEFNLGSPGSRPESINLITYLTDWKKAIPSSGTLGGGMLFYGNGGTTSEAIQYKILDPATGIWGAAQNIVNFDGDSGITNRALRAVRLDSSSTRNEKIAISRHYRSNVTEQSIWAHSWDGSSWRSIMLSSWTSSANLDVRNFDGTYLNNGNYMVVYSDNTSTPKYRVWDGVCWGSEQSLVDLTNNGSGIPLYIVARKRPGTNEVMAVTFGVARDTNTQYFNGSSWALHPRHSATGPANKEMIDFVWSPHNNVRGAVVYPDAASGADARNISLKVFTADGAGGGSWSSEIDSGATGAIIGSMDIDARKEAEEFVSCTKNTANDIYCYRADSAPGWTTPVNQILTTTSDGGVQRSFNISYESLTGNLGIAVYSDTTAIPKLKKYNPSTNSFDASATSLSSVSTALETVRMRPDPASDDIMILLGNTSNDVYTVIWNGSTNAVYTSPSGKVMTNHQPSSNGSADTDFFYDFAWDKF